MPVPKRQPCSAARVATSRQRWPGKRAASTSIPVYPSATAGRSFCMLFKERRFVVSDIASADLLAEKLTNHVWCCCTAFRLGDLLFLNDSSSPDGAAEFGVVRNGEQIESITFGWCTYAQALAYIEQLQAGTLGDAYGLVTNAVETP